MLPGDFNAAWDLVTRRQAVKMEKRRRKVECEYYGRYYGRCTDLRTQYRVTAAAALMPPFIPRLAALLNIDAFSAAVLGFIPCATSECATSSVLFAVAPSVVVI